MKFNRSGWAVTFTGAAVLSVSAALVVAEDVSLFLVGNSLTDAVRAGDLTDVAAAGGQGLTFGQHLIWGASIDWLWSHPDDASKLSSSEQAFGSNFGLWREALPGHAWDAVSLQPFGRPMITPGANNFGDLDHTLRFIDHTLQNPANRNTRFLLYQDSPAKPEDGAEVSFEAWWTQRPYTGQWDQTWDTSAYTYLLRDAVQAALDARPAEQRPTKPIEVVPVGDVFLALDRAMRAGELAGYPAGSSVWDLYTDHVHFNGTGQYAAAMTYYAVLFGESPVGLPVGRYAIPAERAAQVQALVWDVVSGAAIGGVNGDANGDGAVNQTDLDVVLNGWGQAAGGAASGDFDGNGFVDQFDLDAVLNGWGASAAGSVRGVSVPEPVAGGAVGMAVLLSGRRFGR